MIKTILVPATGNQTDNAVFTSALAAARAFNAHLDFLHVRVDAAAMVAAMATDGSGAAMVSGLVERADEEATRREDAARQLFQRFCERERLLIEDTPASQQSPTAQWLRQIGDEAYWVREYGRAADLLVVGHPAEDQGVLIDTIEAALVIAEGTVNVAYTVIGPIKFGRMCLTNTRRSFRPSARQASMNG